MWSNYKLIFFILDACDCEAYEDEGRRKYLADICAAEKKISRGKIQRHAPRENFLRDSQRLIDRPIYFSYNASSFH